MKLKFFLLTFLLLFVRGCDFYSTSLWFFDNPSGEQNPLYKIFGVGWTGLIIANIVIVGLIIYAFYYYSFRYTRTKLNRNQANLLIMFLKYILTKKDDFLTYFIKHLITKRHF